MSDTYVFDSELGEYKLDCCNWRAVTEIKNEPLLITVNHKVYKLVDKNMTFKSFYDFTQKNAYKQAPLGAIEAGVTLPCPRCGGDGKTDWVEKVMKKEKSTIPPPHTRDPHGRVLKFITPISKNSQVKQQPEHNHPFFVLGYLSDYLEKGITHQFIYISSPHLIETDELCPECYGSGLRIIGDDQTELVVFEG